MDYKEKYEQGLECIQEILCGAGDSIKTSILRKRLQPFFPELKESEDERIRKELIEQVAYIIPNDDEVDGEGDTLPTYQKRIDKYRAWLEKQKVTDEEIIFRPTVGTDIRIAAKQALEKIDIGKKVVLAFNGAYISVNGKTVGEIDSEYDAWLEKQGEKSTIIDIDKMVMKYSQTKDGDFGLPVNCMIRAYRKGINDALFIAFNIEKQKEKDLCTNCINDKGCVTCEHGELQETPTKTVNADEVIAWIVANICDFEYYVKLFKEDFGLC